MSSKKILKRLFSTALALFGVLLAATAPVSAQQSDSSVLDELDAMVIDVRDIDLILNDITHEIYEIMVQVNHARNLIVQSGSTRLIELAIEDAQEFMGLITSGKFAELEGVLDHLNTEVNGNLIPKITTIIEDLGGELTPRDAALMWKLKLKAESIELFTGEIMNEVESLNARLDNPESGEDATTDCETFRTIKACLDAALEAVDPADMSVTKGFLEQAYQNIRRAIREANRIVRKKKLIIMRLSTLISLCSRVEACANFTLSGGSAGTQVKPVELKAEKSATVSVYNLKGQLVVAQTAASALESVKAQLANGVYMAVVQHFDAGGNVISQDVQRLVLVR